MSGQQPTQQEIFRQALKTVKDNLSFVSHDNRKDIVLFLGISQNGKTTILNHLLFYNQADAFKVVLF
jgi:signal recognition particle GTPase